MPNEETRENAHATEGPYPVPGNWRWGRFSNLVTLSKEKTEDFSDMTVRYVGLENMRAGGGISEFTAAAELKSLKNVFHSGQILYGKLRPYLSKHAVAPCDGVCSTDILVFDSTAATVAEYVDYLLETMDFRVFAVENSKGINLPRVSTEKVLGYSVPVPPLAEQRRIVERVERLFAKLDAAKEKAQSVIDGCEKCKAAILHKAFTGELTAEWRKVNKKEYDWVAKKLSDCCQFGSGGTPSRKNPEFYHGRIPWIKTGEINWQDITDAEEKITEDAIEKSAAKLYAPGCVLVAMYGMGATRGRAAILKVPAATNQAVCVLQPDATLNNRFLFYYFMCHYWNIRELAVGGNQLKEPLINVHKT